MEIAIPLVVLAGSYIISKDQKEGFSTLDATVAGNPGTAANAAQTAAQPAGADMAAQGTVAQGTAAQGTAAQGTAAQVGGPPAQASNWPTAKPVAATDPAGINKYSFPNQTTDQYFTNAAAKIRQLNPTDGVGGSKVPQRSLTGEVINPSGFRHNNMVPFFGGRVKGAGPSPESGESRLDAMQGAGSQHIRKKEQATLFRPQKHLSNIGGAPNANDFLQSRVNASLKSSNTLPWEQKRVGPGLGLGYTEQGVGGLNAGVQARDQWLPPTVDDLRVETNPRVSFELKGHEGHAASRIQEPATATTQGNVEKYRPDTYYDNGPDRWLTTPAGQLAPTARSKQMAPDTHRHSKPFSYFGASSGEKDAPTARGNYSAPKRTKLPCAPTPAANAGGKHPGSLHDYGMGSTSVLPNNRSTTRKDTLMGNITSTVSALMAPVTDALRPTLKEETIGNVRVNGIVGGQVSSQPTFNPADRTKTTNRELTEGRQAFGYATVTGTRNGGYHVASQNPKGCQRTSTQTSYMGQAAPATVPAQVSYDAEMRQTNNPYKECLGRTANGGMQMFNSQQNVAVRKSEVGREYSRAPGHLQGPAAIPSAETHGQLNGPQYQPPSQQTGSDRLDGDLLNAFKQNPYTQSLQSWA